MHEEVDHRASSYQKRTAQKKGDEFQLFRHYMKAKIKTIQSGAKVNLLKKIQERYVL